MRVTTVLNRILGLPGSVVGSVAFTDVGLVIEVRMRSRKLVCPCGRVSRGGYDSSVRRWRHVDFGACQVWLQARIRRIDCSGCGRVRTEVVPWARPGARFSKDFEDVAAWLAQRMDKTSTARLLRCSWQAVDAIVCRVVAEHIDDGRLDGLYRIGVDEISYKRGQRYLTVVADHDTGRVVWVGKNRDQKTFEEFFNKLGPDRAAAIEAISADASGIYLPVARQRIPQATVCMDPFHVIVWTNEALELVYRAEAPAIPWGKGLPSRRAWRKARYAVRAGAEHLDDEHRGLLNQLRRRRYRLWRAWELKEQLRDLYRDVNPDHAAAYLKAWCTSALRSRIPPSKGLVRRLRKHFDAIVAAVQLGLSNSRLEGINAKIRLIQRRGYGYRHVDSLLSMIYLCLGGIKITRAGSLGSVLLAAHGPDGRLDFIGAVGSGFTDRMLDQMLRKLTALEVPTSPITGRPVPREYLRGVHWCKPVLIGETRFRHWTPEGTMRHPSWRGLRPDRKLAEITISR